MVERAPPTRRRDYPLCELVPTRWADNDIYGHVNNVIYYSLIDTAVNGAMLRATGMNIHTAAKIALVVESGCRYHAPLEFPQEIALGLKVARLGRTSVTWNIGLFAAAEGADARAAADAHFTHVFVTREDTRPTPWTEPFRTFFQTAMDETSLTG
ncbi:MAG: hotdog domain-containing protein [Pseudomonadota bacterium]